MHRTVTIKFVPPRPIKEKTGKTTTRERHWNTTKILELLRHQLTPTLRHELGDDLELQLVVARQADIQLNFKLDAITDFKEHVGDLIGEVMSEVEPDTYLLP